MPPLTGQYTWSESDDAIQVVIPLKGASPATVDVYAADCILKVSYPPYLVDLDLRGRIDDAGACARVRAGVLTVTAPKAPDSRGAPWGEVAYGRGELSKEERRSRRAAAMKAKEEREAALAERARARRAEDERAALRAQMAADASERQALEDKKAEEKARAEADVFEALERLAADRSAATAATAPTAATAGSGGSGGGAAKSAAAAAGSAGGGGGSGVKSALRQSPVASSGGGGKRVTFNDSPASAAAPAVAAVAAQRAAAAAAAAVAEATPHKVVYDADEDDVGDSDDSDLDNGSGDLGNGGGGHSSGGGGGDAEPAQVQQQEGVDGSGGDAGSGDCSADFSGGACEEGAGDDELTHTPAPRHGGAVAVAFTPRLFPTPARESKAAEENTWIMKNRRHLAKNATVAARLPKGGDVAAALGIEDSDPAWLKGRGDDLYRAGDWRSAINAYSAALEADEALVAARGNRAACHLQLGALDACVRDCSDALVALKDAGGAQAQTMRLLSRRAAALSQQGHYRAASEDLKAALAMEPGNAALQADIERVAAAARADNARRAADALLAKGDLSAADEAYTAILSGDGGGSGGGGVPPAAAVACLSNRAAARLARGAAVGALADADAALSLLQAPAAAAIGSGSGSGGAAVGGALPPAGSERRRAWVLRTLARRGAAATALGRWCDAAATYREALALAPGDEGLTRDLAAVEAQLSGGGGGGTGEGQGVGAVAVAVEAVAAPAVRAQ